LLNPQWLGQQHPPLQAEQQAQEVQ